MADKFVRTYWIVPGQVDKYGNPIQYDTEPTTGILGTGLLGTTPIEVKEEMSPDGEVVVSRRDPRSGEWVEANRVVDKARLDLFKARQDAPKPLTADQERLQKAQADIAEANARKATEPPATITRTRDLGNGQAVTEAVSPEQAQYDAQQAQRAQQQKQQDIANQIALANQAWQQERAKIEDGYRNRQLSLDAARQAAQEAYQKIQAQLESERNAITQRGQDVSLRGQDIEAGVQQRGQNLTYATNLADAGTRAALQFANNFVPAAQLGDFTRAVRGIGAGSAAPVSYQGIPGTPMPNFATMPLDLARQAQAQLPAPYALPQAPPQVQIGQGYALPGAPGQAA